MRKYHRVVLGGKDYYRQYDETLDCYEGELLTEEDVFEQVLEDVVQDVIHVDQSRVQRSIKNITDEDDRLVIQSYVEYLERVVELFE
ncbi:hypothetical protein ASF99_09290 [Exiguobacterium sp. Leaf187]|uniref:hypothetical protein n=1 Tax=Exiguobacterium sp. Leaf187 TaxID=1736294 RepID=UPI0006F66855|nr:hypothetical protein [Exiguobacterium sp. Leaf187]KQS20068.1 hypothetical protein ASF99_09290 [Exiguobacterium sp. Leaf187]